MTIISATTPTISFKFKTVNPADIAAAYLVVKLCDTPVIERDISSAVIGEDTISWVLTQEETLLLTPKNAICTVVCDWKTSNGTRGRSKVGEYTIEESGKLCVI